MKALTRKLNDGVRIAILVGLVIFDALFDAKLYDGPEPDKETP